MKNNLEQVWKEEARKAYQDQRSQDNEGGCREPIGFVQGYIAAKKSDFEEIKTLKEQLAKAEEVLKMCNDGEMFISNGEYNELFKYQYKEWFQDWIEKYFTDKEKQDRENKDEK